MVMTRSKRLRRVTDAIKGCFRTVAYEDRYYEFLAKAAMDAIGQEQGWLDREFDKIHKAAGISRMMELRSGGWEVVVRYPAGQDENGWWDFEYYEGSGRDRTDATLDALAKMRMAVSSGG